MSQDIMFPTTSDILPEWYEPYRRRIHSILSAGYSLVLVSKPHQEVWEKLANELLNFQDRIIIRFTIGSQDNALLKLLEPGAPCFEERLECLKIMHAAGYRTSVSMEPAIDLLNTPDTIKKVMPYCNADIWVGTLNHLTRVRKMNQNNPAVLKAIDEIAMNQSPSAKTHALLKTIQSLSPMLEFKQGDTLGHADFRKQLRLPERKFGVSEWGDNKDKPENYNLLKGCSHNCIYCYAKHDQIQKKIATAESWCNPVLKTSQPKCYRLEQARVSCF